MEASMIGNLVSYFILISVRYLAAVSFFKLTANGRGYKIVGDCVIANLSTIANLASGLKCKQNT
jgi:hypothetical protein